MQGKTLRRVATLSLASVVSLTITSSPAAATHGTLPCSVPPSLSQLFDFIDTLAQLAFVFGIGIASIGLLISGILYALPGEDNSRRAKQVFKNTVIGAFILLSSKAILAFMVGQLGGSFCT